MTRGSHHVVAAGRDGTILRRRRPGSPVLSAVDEAALLEVVRDRLPLPVPRVLRIVDDDTMVMDLIPGEPLLLHLPELGDGQRHVLACQLGRFVATAAGVPVTQLRGLLPVGGGAGDRPRAFRLDVHLGEVPASRREAVVRFLQRGGSPQPRRRFLTHHELGAEHVLVRGGRPVISGVIDFSHAAVADPAQDLGLLLRDLGTRAGGAGYSAFLAAGGSADGTLTRALFHARVGALEQLALGLEHSSEPHQANAVRAIDDLFADVA